MYLKRVAVFHSFNVRRKHVVCKQLHSHQARHKHAAVTIRLNVYYVIIT